MRRTAGPTRSSQDGIVINIAEGVATGNQSALKALYDLLHRYGAPLLHNQRHASAVDVGDVLHDSFIAAASFIKRGLLRTPHHLIGFLRTICARKRCDALRVVTAYQPLGRRLRRIPASRPWFDEEYEENVRRMRAAVKELRPLDRELLSRYYLTDESQEDICRALHITTDQFRRLKSQAVAKLTACMKRRHPALF